MAISRRKFLGFYIPVSLASFSFSSFSLARVNDENNNLRNNNDFVLLSTYDDGGNKSSVVFNDALHESKTIFIDYNFHADKEISFSPEEPLSVFTSPTTNIKGSGFLPKLKTNPNHVISGNTIRRVLEKDDLTYLYDRVYSHQVMAFEAIVRNASRNNFRSENFVSLYSGIESINCEEQRLWAINSVTNAHGLKPGDEVYGIEIDTNIDGAISGGHYVGLYVAGIGDLTDCPNSDGIRIQRLRDGMAKWQFGQRIFDSVTGIGIYDAAEYSIAAYGKGAISRFDNEENGNWSFSHYGPSKKILWGVDNCGDTYSRKLYLGTGDGKEKNRINLEGGVYFYKSKNSIKISSLLSNNHLDFLIDDVFDIKEVIDFSRATVVFNPVIENTKFPMINIIGMYVLSEGRYYMRIINLENSSVNNVSFSINAMICVHAI